MQLLPKPFYRQGLEHIADDIILDGLLGVFKVVVAAEERDVGGGPHLPHLPGQLNPGDKGHPDVREQQVRLPLLHQLEGIQTVAGAAHQQEAELLPGDHAAHRLPKLVLVVGDYHSIQGVLGHRITCPFAMKDRLPMALIQYSAGSACGTLSG